MLRRPTSLGTYEESQGSNWPSVSCSMISKPTPQSGCSNDRNFCPNRSRTSETVTARFMRCSCHQESVPKGARKSVVWGKSVSVRVDLGGRRIDKKQKSNRHNKIRHNKVQK